jgi:hypothetical protein
MCSLGIAGLLLATAGTAAANNQSSGRIQTTGAVANTAPIDAYAAQQKADHARAEGDRKINQERRKYLQSEGRTQSTLAANGVSLASGSAIDLLVNNRAFAQEQMSDIRYESDMQAWEYDMSKAKSESRSLIPTQTYKRESWGDTLTNPVFVIGTTQKALTLFGRE